MATITKAQALQTFFKQFFDKCYAANDAPETTTFPFMTYEFSTGSINDGEIAIVADLWFLTDSEKTPNKKAQDIADAIGLGGIMLPYTGGAIWLKRGSPFCNAITDDTNHKIKRRVINLSAEFLSAD